VAHGALTPASVLFTGEGSPTLVGFGAAAIFPPGSPEVVLETIPQVAADRRSLRELGRMLLGRVADGPHGASVELSGRLEQAPPDELTAMLVDGLFELAPPIPVRFTPDDPRDVAVGPISLTFDPGLSQADQEVDGAEASATPEASIPALLATVLGMLLEKLLGRRFELGALARLRQRVLARWGSWQPRRRRMVVAIASAATVVAIALVAVPVPAPATAPHPDPRGTEAASTTEPSNAAPSAAEASASEHDAAVTGDDPVAAAVALLERRDGCIRAASLLCLDGVVQPGSSAEAEDRDTVRAIQNGAEPPAPAEPDDVVLIERLGDSALVSLGSANAQTQPASLLLMKSEAGWRIRDYLTAPE
jgi:hypothetical protein